MYVSTLDSERDCFKQSHVLKQK